MKTKTNESAGIKIKIKLFLISMHNTEIEIVTDRTEKDKDAFPNPEFLEHYRTKTESPRLDLSSHDNLRGGGDVCHLPGQLIEII